MQNNEKLYCPKCGTGCTDVVSFYEAVRLAFHKEKSNDGLTKKIDELLVKYSAKEEDAE